MTNELLEDFFKLRFVDFHLIQWNNIDGIFFFFQFGGISAEQLSFHFYQSFPEASDMSGMKAVSNGERESGSW